MCLTEGFSCSPYSRAVTRCSGLVVVVSSRGIIIITVEEPEVTAVCLFSYAERL